MNTVTVKLNLEEGKEGMIWASAEDPIGNMYPNTAGYTIQEIKENVRNLLIEDGQITEEIELQFDLMLICCITIKRIDVLRHRGFRDWNSCLLATAVKRIYNPMQVEVGLSYVTMRGMYEETKTWAIVDCFHKEDYKKAIRAALWKNSYDVILRRKLKPDEI